MNEVAKVNPVCRNTAGSAFVIFVRYFLLPKPAEGLLAVSLPTKLTVGLFGSAVEILKRAKLIPEHGKKGFERVVAPAGSSRIYVFFDQRPGLAGCFLGRLGSRL
ncbi:MAG: hypothetical protein JNJ90_00970 [Saprospiraceae bacterium]|nr:hypothetical protein [Saprospiraceae bacterium]